MSKDSKGRTDASILRDNVERRASPADGTVVIFDYVKDMDVPKKERESIKHVAMYDEGNNNWGISPMRESALSRTQAHATFMTTLASPRVIRAEVVVGTEPFKP